MTESLNVLTDLIAKTRTLGADAADAVYVKGTSLSVAQRLGNPERVERSEGQDLGLRVFIGKQQAVVSSSDTSPAALAELAERAVAMARVVPEDPYCGLADPDQLVTSVPDLDIFDPYEPSAETLVDWATRAEEAARSVEGVSNSEGADAGWGSSEVFLAASNGFAQTYATSGVSLSASVLAGEGTSMERDYDYCTTVYADDMEKPETIGLKAGTKAVARLNPGRMETGQVPIVFDPRVSGSLIGHFSGAINGSGIARGTSFLKDMMDQQVFARGITIVDDPHRLRGLRSKPFDGEGLANGPLTLIEDGVLKTWIMDLRSARQLGLSSVGRASRGTGSPPSPSTTNLYMAAGSQSPKELMADIKDGLYVTEMIGMGVNGVTGDYSRGAAGVRIVNGELTGPVSELTIAGNLKDMYMNLTPADDLVFRYGTNAPTLRIDGMTVAGQ